MLGLSESGFVRGGAGWGPPEKITFTIHFRRYVSDCKGKCCEFHDTMHKIQIAALINNKLSSAKATGCSRTG